MSDERYFGTVVWFQPNKGFGFLQPDTMEKQVFVHFSQIKMDGYRELQDGQRVEFSLGERDGKPQAENVVPMETQETSA